MNAVSSATVLMLDPADDVAVAVADIPPGTDLPQIGVAAQEFVRAGHKLAIKRIPSGGAIAKYGQCIGVATQDIAPGCHVHVHNLAAAEFERVSGRELTAAAQSAATPQYFQGFRRHNGRAGTRNYLGIVASVNCSATVAQHIADSLRDAIREFDAIDGIVPITHAFGCCQASDALGMRQLQRTLAGYSVHPNFAAVLVLGLGCETNQIASMLDVAGLAENGRLRTLTIQDAGGTRAAIDQGRQILLEMAPAANAAVRQPIAVSDLVLGLQCGGSDGYSGISANPALGRAVDLLVGQGGTAILSETPEIYGAEHLLMARAESAKVASDLEHLIESWEDYASRNDAELDNNPTYGNKQGGLTTILEKSLGAVAKGGSTPLTGVYQYAQPIDRNGLVFMDSPGYDPMSITGQIAAGANLVAFTTGRGSVFGCKPAPSLKIATNTAMFERMRDDMDVNCGRIVDGDSSIAAMGAEIFDHLLDMASGERPRSEQLGFGNTEFVPWVPGAQL